MSTIEQYAGWIDDNAYGLLKDARVQAEQLKQQADDILKVAGRRVEKIDAHTDAQVQIEENRKADAPEEPTPDEPIPPEEPTPDPIPPIDDPTNGLRSEPITNANFRPESELPVYNQDIDASLASDSIVYKEGTPWSQLDGAIMNIYPKPDGSEWENLGFTLRYANEDARYIFRGIGPTRIPAQAVSGRVEYWRPDQGYKNIAMQIENFDVRGSGGKGAVYWEGFRLLSVLNSAISNSGGNCIFWRGNNEQSEFFGDNLDLHHGGGSGSAHLGYGTFMRWNTLQRSRLSTARAEGHIWKVYSQYISFLNNMVTSYNDEADRAVYYGELPQLDIGAMAEECYIEGNVFHKRAAPVGAKQRIAIIQFRDRLYANNPNTGWGTDALVATPHDLIKTIKNNLFRNDALNGTAALIRDMGTGLAGSQRNVINFDDNTNIREGKYAFDQIIRTEY